MTVRWVALACLVAPFAAAGGQIRSETHRFSPQSFYNTYSAAHPPALRIRPGDRVSTKTVDAAGVDWEGKAVTAGGNPETGLFFVEGADPDPDQIGPCRHLQEQHAAAFRAERPGYLIAAVAGLDIKLRLTPGDPEARGGNPHRGRVGAAALPLTIAAMTEQGEDRLSRALIADRAAQAASGHWRGHRVLPRFMPCPARTYPRAPRRRRRSSRRGYALSHSCTKHR